MTQTYSGSIDAIGSVSVGVPILHGQKNYLEMRDNIARILTDQSGKYKEGADAVFHTLGSDDIAERNIARSSIQPITADNPVRVIDRMADPSQIKPKPKPRSACRTSSLGYFCPSVEMLGSR